jgi:hypothetical protein
MSKFVVRNWGFGIGGYEFRVRGSVFMDVAVFLVAVQISVAIFSARRPVVRYHRCRRLEHYDAPMTSPARLFR